MRCSLFLLDFRIVSRKSGFDCGLQQKKNTQKLTFLGVLSWWARVDSNHRSWKAADLQSVPIGHSGTRPYPICSHRWLPVYFIIWSGICQLLFPRIFSFSVALYFPAFYRNKSTFYNSKRPQNVFRFEVFLELVTGVEPATHWLQISCAAIAPHQHRLPR